MGDIIYGWPAPYVQHRSKYCLHPCLTEFKWRILVELNVRYHGEFALDNFGPCAMDEIFFPRSENSNQGIGSCYRIKPNGKTRFDEVSDVCLDSSGKGSLKSPFSRRDSGLIFT